MICACHNTDILEALRIASRSFVPNGIHTNTYGDATDLQTSTNSHHKNWIDAQIINDGREDGNHGVSYMLFASCNLHLFMIVATRKSINCYGTCAYRLRIWIWKTCRNIDLATFSMSINANAQYSPEHSQFVVTSTFSSAHTHKTHTEAMNVRLK